MRFIVVGFNHQTAPVEIRERVSVSDVALDDVLTTLRSSRSVMESVVLSTCNRTELYCVVSSERAGADYLSSLLAHQANESVDILKPFLFVKTGHDAVHHLFRVACGLDSLIVGETQILGQVRSAYLTAVNEGNVGALLHQCFRLAIQTGKQAQTDTAVGQSPVSVSYAAVQLAKKILGDLRHRRVLIIGSGTMSVLSGQHVKANGAGHIAIVNRTWEHAQELAHQLDGVAHPWDKLTDVVQEADVIISSTGAPGFVLTESNLLAAQKARNYRPMVVIDIAVPRDVEPGVGRLKNVFHFDIDDLEGVVAVNVQERKRASVQVERLIVSAMSDLADWLSAQSVVPVIAAIRQRGVEVEASVLESLRRKLPHLSERDMGLIHKHTMSIVNQMLRDPVQNMKEIAMTPGGAKQVEGFARLFGVSSIPSQSLQTDLLDGFHKVDATAEGFAGLAAALRAWRNAWRAGDTSGDGMTAVESAASPSVR